MEAKIKVKDSFFETYDWNGCLVNSTGHKSQA